MPLSEAAILAWEQKQKIFKMPPSLILIFMLYASFVPILKPLPHLAQFLHVSAVLSAILAWARKLKRGLEPGKKPCLIKKMWGLIFANSSSNLQRIHEVGFTLARARVIAKLHNAVLMLLKFLTVTDMAVIWNIVHSLVTILYLAQALTQYLTNFDYELNLGAQVNMIWTEFKKKYVYGWAHIPINSMSWIPS